MTKAADNVLSIQCRRTDAERLRQSLAAELANATDEGDEVNLNHRVIRGADAMTMAQFTLDVSVHVDVGHVLLALGGLLATLRALVIFRGQPKVIESENDVKGIADSLPSPTEDDAEVDASDNFKGRSE